MSQRSVGAMELCVSGQNAQWNDGRCDHQPLFRNHSNFSASFFFRRFWRSNLWIDGIFMGGLFCEMQSQSGFSRFLHSRSEDLERDWRTDFVAPCVYLLQFASNVFISREILPKEKLQSGIVDPSFLSHSQSLRRSYASRMRSSGEANQRTLRWLPLRCSTRLSPQQCAIISPNRSRSLHFPQRNESRCGHFVLGIHLPHPAFGSDLPTHHRLLSRNESSAPWQARDQGVSDASQSRNQQIRLHAQVDRLFVSVSRRSSFLSYAQPTYINFFQSSFNFFNSGTVLPLRLDRKTHVFTNQSMEQIVLFGGWAER